jgi:hypothetical protein
LPLVKEYKKLNVEAINTYLQLPRKMTGKYKTFPFVPTKQFDVL